MFLNFFISVVFHVSIANAISKFIALTFSAFRSVSVFYFHIPLYTLHRTILSGHSTVV